jgi:hypothetical protein
MSRNRNEISYTNGLSSFNDELENESTSTGDMSGSSRMINTPGGTISVSSISQASVQSDRSAAGSKRMLAEIYLNGCSEPFSKHEVRKIKNVIKLNIFPQLKFCKGEGKKKGNKNGGVLGKCHETPDLTRNNGYAVTILNLCGKDTDHRATLTHRAQWWKTYQSYIKREISQKRGLIAYASKELFKQGKSMLGYW